MDQIKSRTRAVRKITRFGIGIKIFTKKEKKQKKETIMPRRE